MIFTLINIFFILLNFCMALTASQTSTNQFIDAANNCETFKQFFNEKSPTYEQMKELFPLIAKNEITHSEVLRFFLHKMIYNSREENGKLIVEIRDEYANDHSCKELLLTTVKDIIRKTIYTNIDQVFYKRGIGRIAKLEAIVPHLGGDQVLDLISQEGLHRLEVQGRSVFIKNVISKSNVESMRGFFKDLSDENREQKLKEIFRPLLDTNNFDWLDHYKTLEDLFILNGSKIESVRRVIKEYLRENEFLLFFSKSINSQNQGEDFLDFLTLILDRDFHIFEDSKGNTIDHVFAFSNHGRMQAVKIAVLRHFNVDDDPFSSGSSHSPAGTYFRYRLEHNTFKNIKGYKPIDIFYAQQKLSYLQDLGLKLPLLLSLIAGTSHYFINRSIFAKQQKIQRQMTDKEVLWHLFSEEKKHLTAIICSYISMVGLAGGAYSLHKTIRSVGEGPEEFLTFFPLLIGALCSAVPPFFWVLAGFADSNMHPKEEFQEKSTMYEISHLPALISFVLSALSVLGVDFFAIKAG